MSYVTPEMRRIMVIAKKAGKKTKEIAEFLEVSRKTVWKWNKRANHPGKESFRESLQSPPPYIKYLLEHVFGEWKNIEASRQSINNVLI